MEYEIPKLFPFEWWLFEMAIFYLLQDMIVYRMCVNMFTYMPDICSGKTNM